MMIHFCPKIFFSPRKKWKIKNVRMHQIWWLQNKDNTNRRRMVCVYASYWYCIRYEFCCIIIYLNNTNFQEKKSILTTLTMALNYSLQYLVPAGSYQVQHILIDMTLLIFLLKDIIIYNTRLGKHKKQGMWNLTIVYL